MNDVLTEEEQITAIKNWWKENGSQVLMVGCLVAVAYFGYNWWQNKQQTQLNDVLLAYEQYIEAISDAATSLDPSDSQVKTVNFMTDQLIEDYGDSHYAFLASMNTAAFDVRRGELEEALNRLSWAKEYAEAEADVQLVNYRDALINAQLGNVDEALAALDNPNEYFISIYAEARGDMLLSAGRSAEALAEYQEALNSSAADDLARISLLQATIDSLQNGPLATSTQPE